MGKQLATIGEALDEISWTWVNDTYPRLASAIEVEVANGARPEQVRRYVMLWTDRYELALRCEQAARHLANG